jgi:hypothetical protein
MNFIVQNTIHSPDGKMFAERIEKENYNDNFNPGDVVGINMGGKLTKVYSNSIHFGIITDVNSSAVIAHCNLNDSNSAIVVFTGRAAVNTIGEVGSFLVPFQTPNDYIVCCSVKESDMSLSHYMKSIGHVISVSGNGVYVIVKH